MAPEHKDVPNPDLPIPGDDNRMSYQEVIVRASATGQQDAHKMSRARSQAIMSHVSAAVAQRMAYKEMSYAVYLTVSICFYAFILLLAMLLADITTIIDIISAYAISCMAFFVPGMFYRKAI